MKRYALCIGNNDYQILDKLSCAINDAKEIAEKLENLGFDVETAFDLQYNQLCSTIVSISDKIKEYDAVLFYYAGHGFEVNNKNILAPIDFNHRDDPKTAEYRSFPIDDLLKLLEGDVSKTKVVILDACRKELGIRGTGRDFAPMVAPQGSIIAFSTSPGQSSSEGETHGLYTESLLKYIDLPRKSIETVFKKVRTELAAKTNGTQIPWEHTSLIGEFYLNPDTIYDGVVYSDNAYADRRFLFDRSSKVGSIVRELKSLDWNIQMPAIAKVRSLDFENASAEELFILGRNIYQAACGNCYDCQRFIENFSKNAYIPSAGKLHILNGMVFEIYYNSYGGLRRNFKNEYSLEVLNIVESEEFFGSCEFIASKLVKEKDSRVYYLPGQNEKVDVTIKLEKTKDGIAIADIVIKGQSHYYKKYSGEKIRIGDFCEECRRDLFEFDLTHKAVAPKGYLNLIYDGVKVKEDDMLLIPFGGYELMPREGTDEED